MKNSTVQFPYVGCVSFSHQKRGNVLSCGEHRHDCFGSHTLVKRSSFSRRTLLMKLISLQLAILDLWGLTGHRRPTSAALGWFLSDQTFHKPVGSCDDLRAVTRGSREVGLMLLVSVLLFLPLGLTPDVLK